MDHIDAMDQLRQGIGLRAYGQSDPVIEYKFEGYEMFKAMIRSIQEDTVKYLFKAQVQNIPQRHQVVQRVSESRENTGRKEPVRNQKVGRNDPCPCGSGKKYKKCCGR
jgi:preprotein translocase subunit SecA